MWHVVHKPSGHKYTLYEKLSRREAQDLILRMSKYNTLVVAKKNAQNKQEQQEIESQIQEEYAEIGKLGALTARRCLRLSQEEIDRIPTDECHALLIKIVQFSIEA